MRHDNHQGHPEAERHCYDMMSMSDAEMEADMRDPQTATVPWQLGIDPKCWQVLPWCGEQLYLDQKAALTLDLDST